MNSDVKVTEGTKLYNHTISVGASTTQIHLSMALLFSEKSQKLQTTSREHEDKHQPSVWKTDKWMGQINGNLQSFSMSHLNSSS